MAAARPSSSGRRQRSTSRTPTVRAWLLTEGSELPGEVNVILVDREPAGRTVQVVTDEPGATRVQYGADDPVDIVRLA